MALTTNQRMLCRVLAVVGVLWLGSIYVLYHQPDWSAPSSASPALVLDPLERPHEETLEELWAAEHDAGPGTEVHSGETNEWKDHNSAALHALLLCQASETCGEHQGKVVILQEGRYRGAFMNRRNGHASSGEQIFARSVLTTLDHLGVTYLFSLGDDHLSFYYGLIPDAIRGVIMSPEDLRFCWNEEQERNSEGSNDCLKSSLNPHGAPIHQLFTPYFFGDEIHPFGWEWTLVPEEYHKGNTYIGYSIEEECMAKKIPAHADRRRQVWVLAKWAHYFTDPGFPLNRDTFVKASEALNVEFVSAWQNDDRDKPDDMPPGVTNLGKGHILDKAAFETAFTNSLAVVGLRDPVVSPTPWYGLCWSVPFLNPTWIEGDGSRNSQHNPAMLIGEPHVYNYPPHDDDAFIEMLRQAIEPHEPFIAPAMTQPEMNRRTLAWLETDWKALAESKLRSDKYKDAFRGKDFLL